MKAKLAINGADPLSLTPDAYATFVREDIAKWRTIVQAAGISME